MVYISIFFFETITITYTKVRQILARVKRTNSFFKYKLRRTKC